MIAGLTRQLAQTFSLRTENECERRRHRHIIEIVIRFAVETDGEEAAFFERGQSARQRGFARAARRVAEFALASRAKARYWARQ